MALRSSRVVPADAVDPARVIDTAMLDFNQRHRRRIVLTTEGGNALMLDLAVAAALQHGDGLETREKNIVLVKAAPERLLEITAADPLLMQRLLWHLGNRHTPAEITREAAYVTFDHVLADMVTGLGGSAREVLRAFQPERGAYAGGGHHHHHEHDHEHGGHGHPHSHD